MNRTRIKICGITRLEDANAAINAGADALGFVLSCKRSKRLIDLTSAANIIKQLPPFISTVGLFVDAAEDFVATAITATGINYLQFHGDETADYCEQFNKPYLKALRVQEGMDIKKFFTQYDSASAILLDAYCEQAHGGTGKTFNWDLIPSGLTKPIILAGGLTDSNVKQAITQVKPYAVDVSSGVESSVGIKDSNKILELINAVHT